MFKTPILALSLAVSMTAGLAVQSEAATTGLFIGTFSGNDPFPDAIFPGTDMESVALYKCDEIEGDDPVCTDENAFAGDYSDNFSITFDEFNDDDEAIGGTWSFVTDLVTPLLPKYIALKAGPNYSVWDIGGLSMGTWSTADTLDSKGISHISFYDSEPAPIPVPAAGLLLVSAIGGMAVLRRRKQA
jgi:hypothetical protein